MAGGGLKAKTSGKKSSNKEASYFCPYCGYKRAASDFYSSSDPMLVTGKTVMCRLCAEKIALGYDPVSKTYSGCTKSSVMSALERLDKPYFDSVWDSSNAEYLKRSKNGTPIKSVWNVYIRQIGSKHYQGMRWRDGDLYATFVNDIKTEEEAKIEVSNVVEKNAQAKKELEINQRDVIRMVGYDPFANYPTESDKPLLYAQLVSFIDDETKNDGMKMNAVIQIVQAFNQIQKINDAINALSSDVAKLNNNNGTIKQHADTINKLLSGANALAKDNGISTNFNNNKSKGANTLTGKMKELNLMGFRSAKINMYDIDYCRGMQQVAEISAKAQIDQIGLDENTLNEIGGIRRELVDRLQKERDIAVERARVLLVENNDLKKFLREKGIMNENGEVTGER